MDEVLRVLADYVTETKIESDEAFETARLCLMDSLGCAMLALNYSECTKLLGPVVHGTIVPAGCRIPGTDFVLDPVQGAFNLGAMIRWLDYNDTWLAAEWGHPSDNIGGLLPLAETIPGFTVSELLEAIIKAYEIQGVLALTNSFNRIGFDHVILVKIATAAVAAHMFGGDKRQVANALSQAFIDTGPLRTYRHAPCTGSRKSWAAGDAARRGIQLAMITRQGEMGYPEALTAEKWGFNDCMTKIMLPQTLSSYVIENILFKVSFPAEFHAQTAVECAFRLHPTIKDRLDDIKKIEIETHESALRIIDKTGPLKNPADRDHCMQYMVAVGLIHGTLEADHYEDEAAEDPRIDKLREKMELTESEEYSRDYLNPDKRSIASAVAIHFQDGSKTDRIEVEYPLGHRRRREEALPHLFEKARHNLKTRFPKNRVEKILTLFEEPKQLDNLIVGDLIDSFV